MDYREEIKRLRAQLNENGYRYYVLDAPTMSDYEYDQLNRRLEELEQEHPEEVTPDSPTQRIGGRILEGFEPFAHEVPLESLADVFSPEEVDEFCGKMRAALGDVEYSLEPKVDGLSVALEYRDGAFFRGATRGDGLVGEDVTENLRTIRSIPMTLPEKLPRLIVRGEVYMARSVFAKLNAQREENGEPTFANPRNAAAGSLRQLDSKIAAQRQLDIQIFNLQLVDGLEFATHSATLDYLESQHFKVIPHRVVHTAEECRQEIVAINERRMNYPFDMDGAVVKVNSLTDRDELGSTAKFPKWAIAYKYPPEKKPSRVLDIVVQVGRTGVLTPRAVLEPVHLSGTTVQSATLHNQDYIAEKDIRIGDTVLVQKAGEIIPEIVEVVVSKRPKEGTKPYFLPETCPVCGAPVSRDPDGAAVRCTGAECPAQLLRNLTHFVSRDAMDIDGLGPAVLQQLIDHKLVAGAGDLYSLRREDLLPLDRMGELSASNLIVAIENSKNGDLAKLLYALGIRQVGVKAAKVLASHFKSFDALESATLEELTDIGDVGPVTAQYILDWLKSPQSKDLISKLRLAGVNLESKAQLVDHRFAGMTFVLTGKLTQFERKAAEAMIEERGGKAASSVSKRTTYVVAGEDAGSKLKRAQELGIPVLSENEFAEMIE